MGEAFSFLSGLFFRGKLGSAQRFTSPPAGLPGVLVFTTNRGLLPADHRVKPVELEHFGSWSGLEAVLLGSVATGKHMDLPPATPGERLLFPVGFVGRGNMSRRAMLLRAAQEGIELWSTDRCSVPSAEDGAR